MSASTALDLWSDDIHLDILTPNTILRAQVPALSRKVEDLLRAEVRTDVSQAKMEHSLDLIAPLLNDYRVTLLKAWHDPELVYPAIVKSRGLLPPPPTNPRMDLPTSLSQAFLAVATLELVPPADERTAHSQEEFIKLISQILKSGWVRALVQSLIARSNEMLTEKEGSSRSGEAHSTSE